MCNRRIKFLVLMAFLVLPFLSGCMPHKVESTQVGIRVKKIGILDKAGVMEKVFDPGTYFFLPLLNDWYTLDTTLKTLEMTLVADSEGSRSNDDLIFKTIDGNDISLDVVITYKIDPDKAYYIVQYVGLTDYDIKNHIIRSVARSKPRDIFGELTTEQFYDPVKRSEKAGEVEIALNGILNPYGIIIDGVKTKDYRFNSSYERAIKDKKIADQQTQKYISATKAKAEEYKKKLEDSNGDVQEMIAKVEGVYKQAVLGADAYYEERKQEAKAIEIEGKAQAEAIIKMNESLEGEGGLAKVKLEIAKALQDKKILLMPFTQEGFDIKSTNINRLIDTYGAKSLAKKQAHS